jgi:hypothetical protein
MRWWGKHFANRSSAYGSGSPQVRGLVARFGLRSAYDVTIGRPLAKHVMPERMLATVDAKTLQHHVLTKQQLSPPPQASRFEVS